MTLVFWIAIVMDAALIAVVIWQRLGLVKIIEAQDRVIRGQAEVIGRLLERK